MSEPTPRRAFGIERQADEAAQRLETLRAEAFDEGVAHAREEIARAEQALEAREQEMRRELAAALGELGALREALIDEARNALAELAIAAASRMLRARIEADDPVARRALDEVLAAFDPPQRLVVHAHPDDAEALAEGGVEVRPDRQIARGGCRIESDRWLADATVEAAEASQREALDAAESPPIAELERRIEATEPEA